MTLVTVSVKDNALTAKQLAEFVPAEREGSIDDDRLVAFRVVASELALGARLTDFDPTLAHGWSTPTQIAERWQDTSPLRVGRMIAALGLNLILGYGAMVSFGHALFFGVGAYTAGKMSKEDFVGIEKNACPTVGACGGMYTANTMSSAFEALGLSLPYASTMANVEGEIVSMVGGKLAMRWCGSEFRQTTTVSARNPAICASVP